MKISNMYVATLHTLLANLAHNYIDVVYMFTRFSLKSQQEHAVCANIQTSSISK